MMYTRPLGPRSLTNNRPVSPAPQQLPQLPTIQPLTLNKKSQQSSSLAPNPSPPAPPASEPPAGGRPVLNLGIPTPRSRANTPRIKLDIPPSTRPEYYDGPLIQPQSSTENPEEITIVPQNTTVARPSSQRTNEPVPEISSVIRDLKISSEAEAEANGISGESDPFSNRQWTDEDFEELSRLGEGAGGAVHKMRDRKTNKILARKTITTREAPMGQVIREIKFISSTKHVNIIQFFGAYISPSSSEVKILMEYGEGGSLESIGKKIKERGAIVGEKIAGKLAEGILQGLAFLHSKKTIHRDIKPSNVLLSREGVVKLCDFGVSGELIDSLAGTFTGTGIYMAPERITAQEYTIRADVWSTGISLLELVQNRFPFPADLGPIELVMRITKEEPPQLEDGPGAQWSPEMKDFIRQTLIVNHHERPTPRAMLSHPWIVWVMNQEVNMARWVSQVWGWSKPSRPKEHGSRPSSSRRGNSGDFPTLGGDYA